MLGSISWTQFIDFLILATGAYYLYVLVRHYRKEAIALFNRSGGRQALEGEKATGRGAEASGQSEGDDEEGDDGQGTRTEGKVMPSRGKGVDQGVKFRREEDMLGQMPEMEQAGLFDGRAGLEGALPQPLPGQSQELFKVTEKVIILLKGVVSRGGGH